MDGEVCKECYEGCSLCTGPEIMNCLLLKPSFYYHQNTIKQCKTGCAVCDNDSNCVQCREGYSSRPIEIDGKIAMKNNRNLTNCTKCQDSFCQYCSINPALGFETCSYCGEGHGLHPYTKRCMQCLPGCKICRADNFYMCAVCDEGYVLNTSSMTCAPSRIPKCVSMSLMNPLECETCVAGFIPDPDDKTKCVSCASKIAGCSWCRADSSKQINCLSCSLGYGRVYGRNNMCQKCPDECKTCEAAITDASQNLTETKCTSCKPKHKLDIQNQYKCVESPQVSHCVNQLLDGRCAYCDRGYFVGGDEICHKCHDTCGTCVGKEPTDCGLCPVTSLYLGITGQKMGIFRFNHYQCASVCPDADTNGDKFAVDEFSRSCQTNLHTNISPKEQYHFKRSPSSSVSSFLNDARTFGYDYDRFTSMIGSKAIKWAEEHAQDAQKKAPECTYHGVVLEEVSLERQSYYECDCDQGYFGNNCDVDTELKNSVNMFITQFLRDLRGASSIIHPDEMHRIFKSIHIVDLDFESLSLLMNTLISYHDTQGYYLDDMEDFFYTLDAIFLNLFSQMREVKRNSKKSTDTSFRDFIEELHHRFRIMANFAENMVALNPSPKAKLNTISTKAFQTMSDRNLSDSFFLSRMDLSILPTDILDQGNLHDKLYFNFYEPAITKHAEYVMTGWLYSGLLFADLNLFQGGYIVSSVFQMTLAHKTQQNFINTTSPQATLKIKFPLRNRPAQQDLALVLSCATLVYGQERVPKVNLIPINTFHLDPATKKLLIECQFTQPSLPNNFFTLVYKGAGVDPIPQVNHVDAQSERDDSPEILPDFTFPMSDPTPSSSLMTQSATLLLLLLTIIIHY